MQLLGPMQVRVSGQPVDIPAKKARALLAYLTLRKGVAVPRDTLTALLWGDRGDEQARASLRQTLSAIRKTLGESGNTALVITGETVRLVPDYCLTDVDDVNSCSDSSPTAELTEAAKQCRGELLEGLSVEEPAFEQWLTAERESMRVLAIRIHELLADRLETEGNIESAIAHTARLVALDPLQEEVQRRLMRLYLMQGRHEAALNQFAVLKKELALQLGVEPAQDTLNLVTAIRAGRRQTSGAGANAPARESPSVKPPETSPALPEKPSIAVLPFTNLSPDRDQEFFSDGISEDIITELSRYNELFVIARNSSFAFKGPAVDLSDVGHKLGVRYVLEGSVRKSGNRIRVTAQLIDAGSKEHIWAERYDREIVDIFEIQDELTRSIVSTLKARVDGDLVRRASLKPTNSLSAYECVLRGQYLVHRYREAEFDKAREFFGNAVALDPEFARAHGWLAYLKTISQLYWQMSTEGLEEAIRIGETGLSFDENDSRCHLALGVAFLFTMRPERSEHHLKRAAMINPNDDLVMIELSRYKMYTGSPLEGAEDAKRAMRQNPFHPNWYWNILARCLHTAGDYRGAISALQQMETIPFWSQAYLAACYAELGETKVAMEHRDLALNLKPDFSVRKFRMLFPYRDPAVLERFFAGFTKAGFAD